jgi:hypothetical protein
MPTLSKQNIATLKNAVKKLTGAKRRAFEAQVTLDYFDAKAYLAEQAIGWDRKTIALGLNELRTGIVCVDNFKACGNQKTEVKKTAIESRYRRFSRTSKPD